MQSIGGQLEVRSLIHVCNQPKIVMTWRDTAKRMALCPSTWNIETNVFSSVNFMLFFPQALDEEIGFIAEGKKQFSYLFLIIENIGPVYPSQQFLALVYKPIWQLGLPYHPGQLYHLCWRVSSCVTFFARSSISNKTWSSLWKTR